MTKLVAQSPTRALVHASREELASLARQLVYTDKDAVHALQRHKLNKRWRQSDEDSWLARAEEIKSQITVSLIHPSEEGPWTRPGVVPWIKGVELDKSAIVYPKPRPFPWRKKLPFELHPYQSSSIAKLLAEKHGNVELTTGAGKTAILIVIARELGLPTVAVAPSIPIFEELHRKFVEHFGQQNVGAFGDGKKQIGRTFTVCVAKSLSNLKPGTKEWEFFQKTSVMLVDESHTWGANLLESTCHGVLSEVPYRFFFSGTQTRADGSELLLRSIIGRTVEKLETWEAVEGGYISKHSFRIAKVYSHDPTYAVKDPILMKREHFLRNPNIAQFIARFGNAVAQTRNENTLVLVEEVNQIAMLAKMLKVPYAIAHSTKDKKELLEHGLPAVDPTESLEKFNRGEVKMLIGTRCISTGSNIYPMHHTFNWQGGSSEVATKQGAVGRSVRLQSQCPYPWVGPSKESVTIWDFDVADIPATEKQLKKRLAFYADSRAEIKRVG